MARFNLVKIGFSKNTLIEWTCIQVVKNVSYCLVIVLKVIKMMFHIGTKNIVGYHTDHPAGGFVHLVIEYLV